MLTTRIYRNLLSFIILFIFLNIVQMDAQNLYWSLGGVYSHSGNQHFTKVNIPMNKNYVVNTDDLCNYKFYDVNNGRHFKTITDTSSFYGTGDFLIYDNDNYLISHGLNVIDINSSQIIRQLEKPVIEELVWIANFNDFQSCLINGKKTIIGQIGRGYTSPSGSNYLIFWDFESGNIIKIYNKSYKNNSIKSFMVTNDNKLLINYERIIVVYNPVTDKIEKEISPDPTEDQFVGYSNNVISSINSNFYTNIKLYDYPGLKSTGSLKVTGTSSQSLGENIDISPNGSQILYKIGANSSIITRIGISNTVTKKEIFQFLPATIVDNNVFIDENSFLTSNSGGFELMLYNFNENGIIRALPIAPFTGLLTSDIEYSNNGLIAVNSNFGVYLFDFNKKTLLKSIFNNVWASDLDYRFRKYDIDLSDDGKYLGYIENSFNRVYIHNIALDTTYTIEKAHNSLITSIKIIPEKNIIITGGSDANLKVWDLGTRKLKDSIYLKLENEEFPVLDFSSYDNYKTVVVITHYQNGATGHTLKVNLESKKLERYVYSQFVYWDIFPASFSSNSKYFANASSFDKIELFDLTENESANGYKQFRYSDFLESNLKHVSSLGISKNGDYLAVSYPENTKIDIYKVEGDKLQILQTIETGLSVKIYDGHDKEWKFAPINQIKFSPDDKYISVTSFQNNMLIYDISQLTSVDERISKGDNWFNLFPNPVENILNISNIPESFQNSDKITINIYQTNMALIDEISLNYTGGNILVDVQHFASGIYFIELVSTNNRIISKFIKK